jgi:hypothetical protein
LNDSLQTYNRTINNLELEDLYVKSVEHRFDINPERKDYLTADREWIGLKIPVLVNVTDLMELDESYGKNIHLLKEKLTDCAHTAITDFIINLKAGEFYDKIETDSAFRKGFVEKIRQKINNLIAAEVTVRNVDYGDIPKPDPTWTSFKAVISKDLKELVITGSFSADKYDMAKIHIGQRQIFTVEKAGEKIIETLEASFINGYIRSSEEFEKVVRTLLTETISDAFGVIIKTQNISAKLNDLSFVDEAINEEIRKIKGEIIRDIVDGMPPEMIEEKRDRISMLEKERTKNSESHLISTRDSYKLPDSKETV